MSLYSNSEARGEVDKLPAGLRSFVLRQFELYDASGGPEEIPAGMLAPLVRLLACSEFGARVFLRESDWLLGQRERLDRPPDAGDLQAFARRIADSDEPLEIVQQQIRRYRNRYYLQVLWREIAGRATLDETLYALSELADALLAATAGYARKSLQERFGAVRDDEGQPVSLVIVGMGKLGGHELNFSSDIDIIFLYPGGSDSDGRRSLSAQEYFARLSQTVIALIGEPTADGFAFRVDTRLRPFGDSGPPVTSFAALESYLVKHGRGWERYAYVKARVVGPEPPAAVRDELYDTIIRPFVYRGYVDYGVFESLREMHSLIAADVQRHDLADNVKLGRGGIREIEFIVQSLQLVRGGSRPDLQSRRLQRVLPLLTGRHGFEARDVEALQAAYVFLRRLENFIQAIRDQQTHELPVDETDRLRIAVAMDFAGWPELEAEIDRHRDNVAAQFEKIVFREQVEDTRHEALRRFSGLWNSAADGADWTAALREEGFADAEAMAELVVGFRSSSAHADITASRRLREFVPNILCLSKNTRAPLLALQRILAVASQVVRRSAYIALLNENAAALAKLVGLCARSAYVATQIARYPVLLDELLDPRIYSEKISRAAMQAELAEREDELELQKADLDDNVEAQMEVLARFQRSMMFRIALADFDQSLPIMRVSDCLTELAETVLEFALQVAWRDLTKKHGPPGDAGFAIIGYGKLGGLELSYGSDLDLVFLHDTIAGGQFTDGAKPLEHTMFFTRLVRRLVHFLTTQTGSGMLYDVDTRLRPDGKSGLLVTSIEAFARYQQENAWTWEHQALLRARPVAGSTALAREFSRIRERTLMSGLRKDKLRDDVVAMRARMRSSLDKSSIDQFDLKQGKGGIGDIEFLVQYLVLANAAEYPSVIEYPDNIRQLDALAASGVVEMAWAHRMQDIYREYRQRVHHLLLDEKAAFVPQTDLEQQRQFVTQAWSRHLPG